MNNDNLISALESILFFWGDPLDFESLMNILEVDRPKLYEIINELEGQYKNNSRGIEVKKIDDSIQLVTKKENSSYISKLSRNVDEKNLSKSLMETLSIIAYKQPATRVEVDSIRGVNSSSSISKLLKRGLIEEKGKLDQIGKPIIYGTTDEFLRVFGLETIFDLPQIDSKGKKDSE